MFLIVYIYNDIERVLFAKRPEANRSSMFRAIKQNGIKLTIIQVEGSKDNSSEPIFSLVELLSLTCSLFPFSILFQYSNW